MKNLDRIIHAVHLQEPYHWACRQYRKIARLRRRGQPRLAMSPEETKQRHAQKASDLLDAFLLSRGTLVFQPSTTPLVSIVIVLFNRAELTLACIRSLLGSSIACEIIVIDNCSNDQTAALFNKIRGVHYRRNTENVHFLRACNQGAKIASGQYLLLLNSDTEVFPGAIEAAVQRLASDPSIGCVGGRLILPDGRLQEAGCFVWQEATCEGYGRGDQPNDGAYLFARPVDYCSGAFMLTPLDLWNRLGGFDDAFAPAYYEEVDYCFRVWRSGRSVFYEPQAMINHYEFGSSRADTPPTELMLRNQKLFANRHRDSLASRPPAHSRATVSMRSPSLCTRKMVLICDERLPHVKTGAGYPRANRLVRTLVSLGYQVTLYPMTDPPPQETLLDVYRDIPVDVEVLIGEHYGSANLTKLLQERKGLYTTILVSRPTTMKEIRPILRRSPELFSGMHLIYDAEAIFTLRQLRERRIAGTEPSEAEAERLISKELSLCTGFHTVLSVSQEEASHFQRYGMKSVVVGHAVPELVSTAAWESRNDFLFVGAIQGDGGPNFEAVIWFLNEVWPQLMKLLPSSRFVVAGQNLSHRLTRTPLPERVLVTGALDSLDSVYDSARVFVAPTQASAGIPLKVVEAAGRGIPVVCTSLLAGQLRWHDGQELSVADTGNDFVNKCHHLFTNRDLWYSQRELALTSIQREYSEAAFQRQLAEALQPQAITPLAQ